jgi:RecA-family ATPase
MTSINEGVRRYGRRRLHWKIPSLSQKRWAKLPAMRWAIKSLIVRHGTTVLYGLPKIGKKSFIGISMTCALATGKDWCGFATQPAKVLYIIGEGFYGILRRQAAWEKLHGCLAGDNLRYLRVPVNFFEELEVDAAIKALKDQGFEPDFIVIDTLARSMSGGNENDTGDMSVVFKGFALANKGTDTRTLQAYLGHRSIQSTVRYTELAPGRFKNLWR